MEIKKHICNLSLSTVDINRENTCILSTEDKIHCVEFLNIWAQNKEGD